MNRIEIDGQRGTVVADNNAAWDIVHIMRNWDDQTWAWWARHMADYNRIDAASAALKAERIKRLQAAE